MKQIVAVTNSADTLDVDQQTRLSDIRTRFSALCQANQILVPWRGGSASSKKRKIVEAPDKSNDTLHNEQVIQRYVLRYHINILTFANRRMFQSNTRSSQSSAALKQ